MTDAEVMSVMFRALNLSACWCRKRLVGDQYETIKQCSRCAAIALYQTLTGDRPS